MIHGRMSFAAEFQIPNFNLGTSISGSNLIRLLLSRAGKNAAAGAAALKIMPIEAVSMAFSLLGPSVWTIARRSTVKTLISAP